MRRPLLRPLIFALLLAVTGCRDQLVQPSSPSLAQSPADQAALEAQISGLINALFAPKDQGALQKEFARIKNAVARDDEDGAEAAIVAFVKQLLEAQDAGLLQDPNGPAPPAISDALSELVNSVAMFGGLPPIIPESNPFAGDGAVGVVGPEGGTVVSSTGFGGVAFPAGALPEDVVVVVARLPNPAEPGDGPLPTTLTQYPLFYDFSTAPHVPQFGEDVIVGICQLEVGEPFGPPTQEVADRLQLAHPDPANPGQIELLERAVASFVDCSGVTLASGLNESGSLAGRALALVRTGGSRLFDLVRPARAWAIHGGLGGKTRSFSPFGAVDPGLGIVGVCGTAMSGVLATYPSVDIAIANAAPGGVIKLCPQTISVASEYLVDKPLTIEAENPATPPEFQVNFATTPVAFRVNPVLQGLVTFRSLSFTHTGPAVAIEIGLGQVLPGLQGSWWQVLIENSRFTMPPGLGRAVRVFQTAVPNPKVTVRNNDIAGGGFAMVTLTGSSTSTIEVVGNRFTGSFAEGVRIQNEANAVVRSNEFTNGGIGIFLLRVNHALVEDNVVETGFGYGIRIHTVPGFPTSVTVTDNIITGQGGGGPIDNPASYPLLAGILIGPENQVSSGISPGTIALNSNRISGARVAIRVIGGGATVTGSLNATTTNHTGLVLENTSASASSLTISQSDFETTFVPVSFSGPSIPASTLNAQCNWWGTADGPQNIAPGTPISSLSPFATEPVADGSGPCNGILPEWQQVDNGGSYSCALRSNGAAYCWGLNSNGQLGDGTTTSRNIPTPVTGGNTFASISVGDITACGLTESGALYCWGSNLDGALGAGIVDPFSSIPVLVAGGLTWLEVDAGLRNVCGRATTGSLYCWGSNGNGQLGNGTQGTGTSSNVPVPVSNSAALGLRAPSTGFWANCARTASNALYCWGVSGLFGNGPGSGFSLMPTPAGNGLLFESVSMGSLYGCGLQAGGSASCWGGAGFGEIGSGSTTASSVPAGVSGGLSFQQLDANDNNTVLGFTCAVTLTDQAYCWGSNGSGQLGATGASTCTFSNLTFNCSLIPVPVGGGIAFSGIAVGLQHTCGLGRDRAVYCWGLNAQSQVGDGTTTDRPLPVRVRNP